MLEFNVIELDQDDLALAWPLVRASPQQLDLPGWQAFAEALIDRGGGVLAVSACDQALHGVATYEIVDRPNFGRVLHVDTLVAFELTGRARMRGVLLGAVKQLSSALGCSETVISAPRRPRAAAEASSGSWRWGIN